MNSALSANAPSWQCVESRQFLAWHESDEEDIEEIKFERKINAPEGYVIAKEYCERNIISFKTFTRAIERGKIPYIIVSIGNRNQDKIFCAKPQDIEAYMKKRHRRGEA